jgi:hypothetical protein
VKKFAIAIIFFAFSVKMFAFEHICSAELPNDNNNLTEYEFFSVALNDSTDVFSLGISIGGYFLSYKVGWQIYNKYPEQIISNVLNRNAFNKMRQVGANVCITYNSGVYHGLVVHILYPDGNNITITFDTAK